MIANLISNLRFRPPIVQLQLCDNIPLIVRTNVCKLRVLNGETSRRRLDSNWLQNVTKSCIFKKIQGNGSYWLPLFMKNIAKSTYAFSFYFHTLIKQRSDLIQTSFRFTCVHAYITWHCWEQILILNVVYVLLVGDSICLTNSFWHKVYRN